MPPRHPADETAPKIEYLRLFPLVHPPFSEDIRHEDKFEHVQQYLSNRRTPAQAKKAAQKLFRAAHAVSKGRVDDVCQDCSGNSAKIILTCCEFEYPYHLHCIRRRHFDQMYRFEELFRCRYCTTRSKPINVEWLIMPRKEQEDRRRRKHKASRERKALQLKTNAEMKTKEMARNTTRLRRRRAKRKNPDN
ncbi:hypothetical protein B0H16DRAFT_1511301 [Mycena metata]|uniref:Uncharacterized protein n=1 Tax=Mycena metata TaxID=1033252 RepID=A0AAD7NSB3_9AGAR|nr:hypothetical protein B0H16DRAFT_1511301 [Mycena metata]